ASETPSAWRGELPPVTVQIPVYNEANVVERAVDAACRLDYPRDRLEVQVLDDSDDGTSELAARRVEAWRGEGVDAHHLRRPGREGYKAGALAHGAERASGEFFLVLDADFVPDPDLIRRLLPAFSDPDVGMVQAAWAHLNEEGGGWLTRAQALLLDAHFAVEHEARCRAGLFFNFNGTAGMWRRECLADVGGWEGDTLTEDLDLSYRAQLGGWKGVYRDDVRVDGELPASVRSLEVQQERWARGGIQTARKLLPAIWRSDERLAVKAEATSHLLGHLAHPLTTLLGLALAGAGFLGGVHALPDWFHALALSLAVLPFVLFYGTASRLRGAGAAATVRRVAEAMTLGIGLGVPLTRAVARGAVEERGGGVFRRTPKSGAGVLRRYGRCGRASEFSSAAR
ncbi:MAG: glycosyltransferase, partial [Gemmatimonadota bacterium]